MYIPVYRHACVQACVCIQMYIVVCVCNKSCEFGTGSIDMMCVLYIKSFEMTLAAPSATFDSTVPRHLIKDPTQQVT